MKKSEIKRKIQKKLRKTKNLDSHRSSLQFWTKSNLLKISKFDLRN